MIKERIKRELQFEDHDQVEEVLKKKIVVTGEKTVNKESLKN